ncbi:hypothetical protein EGH21_14435 [Halomicroarcula sp. F13]|uniref:Halobacterial output domain-containing protein n=1 Tax=Haloarcula rubra TaxID=2487747 RepID=A0AAW4PRM9_9EURY|nr:HalOD1 output domain-containing protein [Halomicroarcula rubra]MBX0324233.1 hypothetical protein [Halomicroarcula rubra]
MNCPTPSSTANDADALVVAITEAIAAKRGVDPIDLPPLNDYVDVDALASLFPAGTDSRATHGHVRFETANYEVSVYHDGTFDVRPLDDPVSGAAYRERR